MNKVRKKKNLKFELLKKLYIFNNFFYPRIDMSQDALLLWDKFISLDSISV